MRPKLFRLKKYTIEMVALHLAPDPMYLLTVRDRANGDFKIHFSNSRLELIKRARRLIAEIENPNTTAVLKKVGV